MNFFAKVIKKCGYYRRVIKRDAPSFFRWFRIFIDVPKCIIISSVKNKGYKSTLPLAYYYPDNGKISSESGFLKDSCDIDLSIIIPMYNCIAYIEDCLDSVINQKTKYSFEVILIDDGSTDDTGEKAEKYLSDNRIKLIAQHNMGQSVARNKGILHSSGRFLMFVDADDILFPNAVEALMRAAESTNSDIAEGSVLKYYTEITPEMIKNSRGSNHIESYERNPRFVLQTYGYSVAKVFKRELWETLRYPEGYIFEDIITKYILRRKANQVAFIEDVVYGYRRNTASSTHGESSLKKLDSIWVLPKIFVLCEKEDSPRDDMFYLLTMSHIGILNSITMNSHELDIQMACFAEMRKQLQSIQDCRPKRMPLMFRLLEKSILEDKFEAWNFVAETITKYGMLRKWREIN